MIRIRTQLLAAMARALVALAFGFLAPLAWAACPGCCSGHGGISNSCGVGGRVQCADGTTSPSCLCTTCGVSSVVNPPSCSLSAAPFSIQRGGSSTLTASCSPAATFFSWVNANIASNAARGTVSPTTTTTYSVRGSNSAGAGNTASATVTVTAPPAPTCTGGQVLTGSVCACPVGQTVVDGECFAPAPALECGIERWSVKTGTDATATQVATGVAVPTSVANMGSIPAPSSLPPTSRVSPVETTVYAIDARLTQYRLNNDSDYHLVLTDSTGNTMIVELPHPDCVGASSPFRAAIVSARAAVDGRLRTTTAFKQASIPVRVHGIGFFDSLHGQTGVAPNGIELHPVLKIEFSPSGPQGSDPAFPHATDSHRLFNWAEIVYPDLFPKPGTGGVFEQFTYRFYELTGNYLATSSQGRVVVHNGRDWNLLDVGAVVDYFPLAVKAGY